ncbi:MAG: FAD-binding oxidoreductase, partial [Granulosicoccaceae bacterium]
MSQLPAQLLHDLKSISGTAGFRPACERDTSDPRGRYSGNSKWVFRPADTNTLAQIIARCAEARQAVIPLGGATGLVAGHIDQSNRPSVLLSTERLNKIRKVDADDSVLVAEAGAVLANVQQAAAQHRLLFPLSLASEGSCTLGGNLATNAGGVQVLRYGNTRDLVLGIEAVMPNGSVLHNLSPLRKDNTGYDIKNLLIGSEGTLGLITAASLKLFPEVKEHCTALCPLPSPAHALKLLTFLKSAFAESISAFELLAGQGLMFLTEHFPNLQQAHSPPAEWSVLIELGNTRAVSMASDFEQGLAKALEKELITDAVICQSESQRQQLWQLREHIPLANAKVGA